MRYILDHTAYLASKSDKYNASSKARIDVTKILENAGYIPYNIFVKKYPIPKLTGILFLIKYCKLLVKIKAGDELCIQYPVKRTMLYFFQNVIKILKKRKVKVVFIIHDLDYIRLDSYKDLKNAILAPLHLADNIIAHTFNMADHLKNEGITAPINILYLFDYLTKDPIISIDYCLQHKYEVVFAGNLIKSVFLRRLNEYKFEIVRFNLYGLKPVFSFSLGKEYKGAFKPENTSYIQGGWGLVWDGDSLDGCSGLMGNYLRYNASHKLSLYITAGIPVIIWSQCGLAEWITEKKLGITINSLEELDNVLSRISNESYLEILHNVHAQSELLRSGKMLLNALN